MNGCLWVYKIKRNADGSIEDCKVFLVAQGFNQHESVDYTYSYCLMVKSTIIMCVLAVASSRGWQLRQNDVHNAFLNGDINKTLLMCQSLRFEDAENPKKLCLLKKALYDLKQAPHSWYAKLTIF